MFKLLALLLFSLGTAASIVPNQVVEPFNSTPEVSATLQAEGEHDYSYTDYGDTSISRIFDTHELTPTINKVYCAPAGYAFELEISDAQIDEIFYQMDLVSPDYKAHFSISYRYRIYETTVYFAEKGHIYDGSGDKQAAIEWYKDAFKNDINNTTILKIETVTAVSELSLIIEYSFYDKPEAIPGTIPVSKNWHFIFNGDPVNIEPPKEDEHITPKLIISENSESGQKSINVAPVFTPGFFNQYDIDKTGVSYNKHGWLTDDQIEYKHDGETDYLCDYSLTIMAFETAPIAYIPPLQASAELEYPGTPIEARFRLEFVTGGVTHVYWSKQFMIGDPNLRVTIDGLEKRKSIQKDSVHTFSVDFDYLDLEDISRINVLKVESTIDRLLDDGQNVIYCYDGKLPEETKDGVLYYVPSENEIKLHSEGRDDEYLSLPSEGKYYTKGKSDPIENYLILEGTCRPYYPPENPLEEDPSKIPPEATYEEVYNTLNQKLSFSILGRFSSYNLHLEMKFRNGGSSTIIKKYNRTLEVIPPVDTGDTTIIDVPDEINLLVGADDIVLSPNISNFEEDAYYNFRFALNKEGIVEVSETEEGKFLVRPSRAGVVTLTLILDSSEETKPITKDVDIRVIDAIYGVSKIEIPDEFHKAGTDIEIALSIRGFTDIQNVSIKWTVLNKKEEDVTAKMAVVHNNATMTLTNTDSDDYTITASYLDVELDKITIEVRYVNVNSFLRVHIWWMIALTIGLSALVIFLMIASHRGKTTVGHIQRVYDVYCHCIADDVLTKNELNKIRKEITKCLHRCEDLNMDALNQYEKATRYLRKSLGDTKALIRDFDTISAEEKGVYTDRLDKDLHKALNVAQEIENAKELIEQYHMAANRHNFEEIQTEKPKKERKVKTKK